MVDTNSVWLSTEAINGYFSLGSVVVGVVLGWAGSHWLRKKLRIRIFKAPLENLTESIENLKLGISVTRKSKKLKGIKRCEVGLANIGNAAVGALELQLRFPEPVELLGHNLVLSRNAVNATLTGPSLNTDLISIGVPFMNPGESATLQLFLDGNVKSFAVECRKEGVEIRVLDGNSFKSTKDVFLEVLAETSMPFGGGAITAILSKLIFR